MEAGLGEHPKQAEDLSLIHVTCFKCRRRFDLDPVFVGRELRKLKARQPKHYQAVCPACHSVNKISVGEMRKDLDAVADEIEATAKEQADQSSGEQ